MFAWFDTLGLPDAWGRPFGSAAFGACEKSGDDPWTAVENCAWLIEDRGASFRVLTLGLEVKALTKSPGRNPEHGGADRVGFEPRDIAAEAEARLKAALEDIRDNVIRLSGPHTSGVSAPASVQLLALARAFWARGDGPRARELLAAARGLECAGADRPLRECLVPGLADVLTGRVVLALAEPAIPRADVLARAEVVLKGLGESERTMPLKGLVATLRRMVEEDRTHRPPEGFPDACPPAVAAQEWTWRLRDQGGFQKDQPGYCDIFEAEGDSAEPGKRLLALGTAAVPALIDAFEDGGVIRAASESWGSPTPLTVAGAVHQVLYRIAGRGFESRGDAEAWWKGVQEKGLDAMLLEGIRAGDRDSHRQADILVRRSPRAVVEALAIGLPKCTEVFQRAHFVRLLGSIEGDDPLPLLLSEAAASPSMPARVAAAAALRKRGRAEGVAAMIDTWKNAKAEWGLNYVQDFLVECGDPAALRVVGDEFPRFDVSDRIRCMDSIDSGARGWRYPHSTDPAWRKEAERILAGRLADRDLDLRSGEYVGGLYRESPRVCDVAAFVLGRLRTEEKPLDLASSVSARDRACLRLANAWRVEQGLAPLPEDPPVPPAPEPGPGLAGLLQTVRDSAVPADRETALAGIRAEGWGALRPVEEALASLPEKHPARGDLAVLARVLSLTVRVAVLQPAGSPVPESVGARLAAMRGRPLTGEDVTKLLEQAFKTLPRDAEGLDFLLDRPEDGSGVVLRLSVLPAPEAAPTPAPSPAQGGESPEPSAGEWSCDWLIRRSGRDVFDSDPPASDVPASPKDVLGLVGVAGTIGRALEAGPREPLEIRLRVTR